MKAKIQAEHINATLIMIVLGIELATIMAGAKDNKAALNHKNNKAALDEKNVLVKQTDIQIVMKN